MLIKQEVPDLATKDLTPYEKRLAAVMAQLDIKDYAFDYTQQEAWVTFSYNGQSYRLLHSIDNAAGNGQPICNGFYALCQIILTLEDLARASSRGVCDLQTWVEGTLIALPCVKPVEGQAPQSV